MKSMVMKDTALRLDQIHFQTLSEAAAHRLRDAIIAGTLKPGDRLVEQKLAADLGIGQPTLREALKELEFQGFVRKLTNKGTYVTQLGREDIRKILEVRVALESVAVGQAAARWTAEAEHELAGTVTDMETAARSLNLQSFHESDLAFHRRIWQLAGNEYLEATLERIVFSLFVFALLAQEQPQFLAAVEQHREILRGLQTRSSSEARRIFLDVTLAFWNRHHEVGLKTEDLGSV